MRRAWLALWALALPVACAGPPQRPTSYEARDAKKEAIVRLDTDIERYRTELGLQPRPSSWLIQQMHAQPVQPPPAGTSTEDACADVCDLADHICRAQEDICRIADELGDDPWARQKCDSAKASCHEAKKRCTDCREAQGTQR